MEFDWDPSKAATNLKKHRVSFEEAATVFRDDLSVTGRDPDHSVGEQRYITFGVSGQGHVLVVSHTEEENELIRIINARLATKAERKLYEEG